MKPESSKKQSTFKLRPIHFVPKSLIKMLRKLEFCIMFSFSLIECLLSALTLLCCILD
jgi:hypothetical protein